MTPDELRSLADEAMPLTAKERNELAAHRAVHGSDTSTPRADAYDLAGETLGEMAFDLARLCAEQHEAIQGYVVAASRAPGNRDQDEVDAASERLVSALAKLAELNNGAEHSPSAERT